jgi:AraC family transcriptional regulator
MYARRELIAQRESFEPRFVFNNIKEWEGIRVQHCRVRSGETRRRWLAEHQITIPLEGSFTSELHSATGRNRSGVVSVGSTPILPAGQPYWAHWEEEVEEVSLYLAPSLIARAAADSERSARIELIEACMVCDRVINQIGMALMAEVDSDRAASRLYAESLANVLAVHLFRNYTIAGCSARVPTGGLTGHRLRRATEFITENLERDIALAEIACAVDLSPYHFARAFKEATGFTPHQYLIKSRVDRAKSLLAQTRLPLVEIGLQVGFKNQSHFTTTFRQLTSLTPKAYRDTIKP